MRRLTHQRARKFPGTVRASPSPGGEGRGEGGRFLKPIFGVGGGLGREKHFRLRDAPKRRFGATAVRLVTSAATALATILELTVVFRLSSRSGSEAAEPLSSEPQLEGSASACSRSCRDFRRHSVARLGRFQTVSALGWRCAFTHGFSHNRHPIMVRTEMIPPAWKRRSSYFRRTMCRPAGTSNA